MSAAVPEQKNKSIVLRLLIVVFCGYLVLSTGSLWQERNDSKAELAQVNDQIAQTEDRIAQMNDLKENGAQDDLVVKAARKLGYAFPDEQVYVDLSGN